VLRAYLGDSDRWATVTPLVLPGSGDRKFANAERLFFKALRYAGYSAEMVAEIEFHNVSYWLGAGRPCGLGIFAATGSEH
jgi:hypothetical protein